MIINADIKALEVVCAAYLSNDKIMKQEILDKVDIHKANQIAFNLPSRGIAKILKFRIIYGGMEYSFANDPDFEEVSTSEKYWKKVIEQYFSKYKGLAAWHKQIIQQTITEGGFSTPTGRRFNFEPRKNYRGELTWPITQIKNFPVQSLGADITSIARVSFWKRFKEQNIRGLCINSVHDSIVLDVPKEEVEKVVILFHEVFKDLPMNFERLFKVKFDLPMSVEVSVGNNCKELTEYKLT